MRARTRVRKRVHHRLTAEHLKLYSLVRRQWFRLWNKMWRLFLAENRLNVMREEDRMTPFLDWILSATEDANRRFEGIGNIQCDLSLSQLCVLSLCCPRSFVSSRHVLSSCNQRDKGWFLERQTNIPHPPWSYLLMASRLFVTLVCSIYRQTTHLSIFFSVFWVSFLWNICTFLKYDVFW